METGVWYVLTCVYCLHCRYMYLIHCLLQNCISEIAKRQRDTSLQLFD